MTPISYRFGFDPALANRERRRFVEADLKHAKVLISLIKGFEQNADSDYEELFEVFNNKWKYECDRINTFHKPKSYVANSEYFESRFGVKEKQEQFKPGIKILSKLWK